MRLKPKRHEAFKKLFGDSRSLTVVMSHIAEQGFNPLPKDETVLQHWTTLFGTKSKAEAIHLLARVKRAKDNYFKTFSENFAARMFPS